MYNCPNCNTPFEPEIKFCTKCGCNLEETFIINPICPVCSTTYPAGSLFCTKDGAKLVTPEKLIPRCVQCGTQYPAETKFCPKDGSPVIPEAFRYSHHRTKGCLPFEKASLKNRFVAYLLDSLICLGLSIPAIIFYSIGIACISKNYYGHSDYSESILFFILAFFLYFVALIYGFIKDGLGEGQSWGKKIMNIKVVKIADNSNCTKIVSALRTLITWLINIVPLVGLIEPILVLTTSDGRRLADKVAGTIVVNV